MSERYSAHGGYTGFPVGAGIPVPGIKASFPNPVSNQVRELSLIYCQCCRKTI